MAYCHYKRPWPDISQECDEKNCPLKKEPHFEKGRWIEEPEIIIGNDLY